MNVWAGYQGEDATYIPLSKDKKLVVNDSTLMSYCAHLLRGENGQPPDEGRAGEG